ncbi:hypothetical protein WSM22_34670 [Cytophagales bacterium WSM2-2]|nr:hypothetical protein WSM22_34670 [Cytophagales bacterium WSM2-2]
MQANTSEAQVTKDQLETTYNGFLSSLKEKNEGKMKSTLSSFAYMTIKNNMASMGAQFPDALYGAVSDMYDLAKLKFLKLNINGPTAYCIYSEKDDVYIFKYLKEPAGWRYNLVEGYGSAAVSKGLASNDLSFLSDKKYQPDGVLPQVPAAIVQGDYKANLEIWGDGKYEIEVIVNGNTQHKTNGGSSVSPVMGGVKKGNNKIIVKSKSLKPGEDPGTIKVTIRAELTKGEELVEVFAMEEGDPMETITKEFVVKK